MCIFKKTIIILLNMIFMILNINPVDEINNPIKICIIYDKTKYKIEIVNELEKQLKDKNIIIEKDSIINLNKYNPDEYSAVIILSGVLIFTPNLIVTRYIKKHDYKKNIIYFCSTKYEEAAYEFLDQDKIDAITSASENNNIEEIANNILENLYNIINQK